MAAAGQAYGLAPVCDRYEKGSELQALYMPDPPHFALHYPFSTHIHRLSHKGYQECHYIGPGPYTLSLHSSVEIRAGFTPSGAPCSEKMCGT